jgi:hypothetical protein
MSDRTFGFTLIELLVVIAICMNNLEQIGKGLAVYCNEDENGYMPPATVGRNTGQGNLTRFLCQDDAGYAVRAGVACRGAPARARVSAIPRRRRQGEKRG